MAVIVSSALNVVQAVRVKTQTLCFVTGHLHTHPMDLNYIPRRRNQLQKSSGFLC